MPGVCLGVPGNPWRVPGGSLRATWRTLRVPRESQGGPWGSLMQTLFSSVVQIIAGTCPWRVPGCPWRSLAGPWAPLENPKGSQRVPRTSLGVPGGSLTQTLFSSAVQTSAGTTFQHHWFKIELPALDRSKGPPLCFPLILKDSEKFL